MTERDNPPQLPFAQALHDFLCMARGSPQGLILRFFLEQVIWHSDLCAQGSILLYVEPDEQCQQVKFALWKPFTHATSLAALRDETDVFDAEKCGLAWLAFCKRASEFASCATEHPHFVEIPGQDIGTIYCVPFMVEGHEHPFGVVSFHNPVAGGPISEQQRLQMDIAVQALEAMLDLSPCRLTHRNRVFIVHGRSEQYRKGLEEVLHEADIEPVVIQSMARTGQDLLTFLEAKIRDCVAGFILLTPDDEGRLYQFGEALRQRARQNVIFEGGYLTALFRHRQRICFLQFGDLEIPSDLNGLLMERFDGPIDPERIRLTLKHWELLRPLPGPEESGAHKPAQELPNKA